MKNLPLILLFIAQSALSLQSDTGAITGRVLGINGLPAAGVRVALAPPNAEGKIAADVLTAFTVTDETGHYRIENIRPGRYGIVAGAVASPTFYPGTGNASGASLLNVQRNSTMMDLDFALVSPAPQAGKQNASIRLVQPQNRVQLSQTLTVPGPIHAGRVVVDGPAIASFLPKLKITFSRADPLPNTLPVQGSAGASGTQGSTFITSTEVKLDNSFQLELKPMSYRISVGRVDNKPLTGFVVKSITLATSDLLKQDRTANRPTADEIVITLQPIPVSLPIK